jgi:hypothetical protein
MTPTLAAPIVSALQEGRQAYVAVDAQAGPHVTPELYAWSDGELWFAAARTTVKAKRLKRVDAAGAVVSSNDRSVVLRGTVEVVDPLDVSSWLSVARRVPPTLRAAARYGVRNAADLLGFAGDAASGRLGWRVPPLRIGFRMTPSSVALIEGGVVVEAGGDWSVAPTEPRSDEPVGGRRAVIALPGPVALPCSWFADEAKVYVAPQLLDAVGVRGSFPLSVVVDEYNAPGPAAKRGALRRGHGRMSDERGFVDVDLDHLVEWDGVETSARRVG